MVVDGVLDIELFVYSMMHGIFIFQIVIFVHSVDCS